MAINDINLTAAMRSNLLSLQNTQKLMDMTQNRLATGLKVNSALDNPSAFFAAKSLNQRAGDLDSLLDSMGQAIQTLKAADEGITAATKFVQQAKAIAEQASELVAGGADPTADAEVLKLALDYSKVLNKLEDLIGNSGYKGINLLKGDGNSGASATSDSVTLKVYFAEGDRSTAANLELVGQDATALGLGFTSTGADSGTGNWVKDTSSVAWADLDAVNGSINEAIKATDILRSLASGFSTDYNIVANREEFTENLINVLTEGANKLTLADMNEESANMLALQTRQQLGVNSLSLASQAAQSVLRLF